ncbi:hypothetical protein CC80DRAFT_574018 [Byssothecium circinans]|uniref:Uncharacterized protein n=1 Tax=Byssothecium circinans TaxID=147558 RepID=A0A6A5UB74_9PLEO|nr:hypothetical protein CC80DRAFT_574018 [Byssothecium circinans]
MCREDAVVKRWTGSLGRAREGAIVSECSVSCHVFTEHRTIRGWHTMCQAELYCHLRDVKLDSCDGSLRKFRHGRSELPGPSIQSHDPAYSPFLHLSPLDSRISALPRKHRLPRPNKNGKLNINNNSLNHETNPPPPQQNLKHLTHIAPPTHHLTSASVSAKLRHAKNLPARSSTSKMRMYLYVPPSTSPRLISMLELYRSNPSLFSTLFSTTIMQAQHWLRVHHFPTLVQRSRAPRYD